MLKTLLFLLLLVSPRLYSQTNPMNGTWCPVDSLTAYRYEQPVGTVLYKYLHLPSNGGYNLTLFEGTVTPVGRYRGTFSGTDTVSEFIALPQHPGTYISAHGAVVFNFPKESNGFQWFGTLAKHSTGGRYIWTMVDLGTPGTRVRLYIVWARCYRA